MVREDKNGLGECHAPQVVKTQLASKNGRMQMRAPSPARRTDDLAAHPYGPTCPACAHRSCRALRADHQPRRGGRRREFGAEHATADMLNLRRNDLIFWYGEATQTYWVATPTGLVEAQDAEELGALVGVLVKSPTADLGCSLERATEGRPTRPRASASPGAPPFPKEP